MICPYIVHRKTVTQTKTEYDDDGRDIFWEQVQNNAAEAMACVEEGCAAWQGGRCQYRGND